MNIPFSVDQFLAVFAAYNEAVWPLQIVAYLLGVTCIGLVFYGKGGSDRMVCGTLAFFWIWMGLVYHIVHFSRINPAAWIFGAAFIIQGILFLVTGVMSGKIRFRYRKNAFFITGACFIVYAMVIYPIVGFASGHVYPQMPVFGVAPCPVTIFTFGMLLWAVKPLSVHLLIIPLLWSFVGMGAAVSLGVPEDYGLVLAGVVGTALVVVENRRTRSPS